MSDTIAALRRKIEGAGNLRSVVRTMKAMAASNIGQYEKSVLALADYYRAVELGLSTCFRESGPAFMDESRKKEGPEGAPGAVVFGSDQGLVGRFNDNVVDYALKKLASMPSEPKVWAVGERVHTRLEDAKLHPEGLFSLPNSVRAISPLVGKILIESEAYYSRGEITGLYLFYNRPVPGGAIYEPAIQRLLPLDENWQRKLAGIPWPAENLPEVMGADTEVLRTLIREYLFVSIFRACAESLAGENGSRLAAMQRAEKNIDELVTDLGGRFHRLRQSNIDEELFDVISGFEALASKKKYRTLFYGSE